MLPKNSLSISVIMKFISIWNSKIIEKAAIYTFFVRRRSKLTGSIFFKAFTIGLWEKPNATLEEIAFIMKEFAPALSITKQGLSDRIKNGVNFLKIMLWQTMETVLSSAVRVEDIEIINEFKKVYISDTTVVSLPEALADVWPGVGGNASKAALKIQALYDMTTQSFHYLDIDKGTGTDVSFMDKIVPIIRSGELLIADLGFYKLPCFEKIAKKGGYYLSRVKTNTVFYTLSKHTKQFEKVHMGKLLKRSGNAFDFPLYVGAGHSEARIVGVRLPEAVVSQRIRKAREQSRKRGKNLTAQQKELLKWNLYMTNITPVQMSCESIVSLYRARWQIELVFKAWKSHLGIHKIQGAMAERIQCTVYGRLIVITAMFFVFSRIYGYWVSHWEREVSLLKFFSYMRLCVHKVINCLRDGFGPSNLQALLSDIGTLCVREERQRKTTTQVLHEHRLPNHDVENTVLA